MAKAKLRFTERDVSRAIRAVSKTGVLVWRVVVDVHGNIIIEPGDDTPLEQRRTAGARQVGH
jgi:hypothetical protein